jgi:hypothetical protein
VSHPWLYVNSAHLLTRPHFPRRAWTFVTVAQGVIRPSPACAATVRRLAACRRGTARAGQLRRPAILLGLPGVRRRVAGAAPPWGVPASFPS